MQIQLKLLCVFFLYALFSSCAVGRKAIENDKVKLLNQVDTVSFNPQISGGVNYSDSFFFKGLQYLEKDSIQSAISNIEKFISLNPKEPAPYFIMAKIHTLNDKNYELALQNSGKAYFLDEDNKWYRKLYADLLALGGKYEQAAILYEDYIAKGNYDKLLFLNNLYFYKKANNYTKSLAVIDKMDQYTDLEDLQLEILRLGVYDQKKDWKNSEATLKRIVAIDSNNNNYKLLLANFYQRLDRKSKADSVYANLDKNLDLSNTEDRSTYFMSLIQKGDERQLYSIMDKIFNVKTLDSTQIQVLFDAIEKGVVLNYSMEDSFINKLIDLTPLPTTSYYAPEYIATRYLRYNTNDSFYKYAKIALRKGSTNSKLFINLIDKYFLDKNYDSIISLSHHIASMHDDYSFAYSSLGIAYLLKKETDSTVKYLNLAVKKFSSDYSNANRAIIWGLLGDSYHEKSMHELSDNAYDSALYYDPSNHNVLNNYAYYLSERGARLNDALSMSAKSLELKKDLPLYLDTYGWINYKMGNYKEAKTYVHKAVTTSLKPSADLWEHLGDIEQKLGNKAKAVAYWKIAIENGGEQIELEKKISQYENKE